MNKIMINMPKEIRYISDWAEFPLQQLSTGHCIVNKTITGCGYTHYSLTNNQPVILCSPRKFLLENKHEQLSKDYHTYLVINEGEKSLDVDCEDQSKEAVNDFLKLGINLEDNNLFEDLELITNLKNGLITYLFNCKISQFTPKILVTYDSLKYVLDVLKNDLSNYSIIVDEFQNIFMDSRFKASIELNFISYLQDCPNVTYLSATPYIEEYLNELDEFKDLPYYELKWDPCRLQTIKIDLRKTSNISREIDKIISDYLDGRFPEKVDEETGKFCESKEVVFYVNSVRLISTFIKRNHLIPNETNIICADTEKNKKALKRIGHSIGKAPLKGEPHKRFTFCTRTTYTGADFYSTSALSVVVSDCHIDSLSTDIRMDFPQIMGRQRLKENVFRDECIFIYKLADESITVEDYKILSEKKKAETRKDLKHYEILLKSSNEEDVEAQKMLKDIRLRIKFQRYSEDYTGIDEKTGKPVINKLVLISERRAFELRSDVYKSDVQVYNEFADLSIQLSIEESLEKAKKLEELRKLIKEKGSFEVKMKAVCDILLDPFWFARIHISDLYWLNLNYRNYLYYLGPERIRANAYKENSIKKEYWSIRSCGGIKEEAFSIFLVGKRYTLKDIKEQFKNIYIKLGIDKSPKASDLEEYFNVKKCLLTIDGKKVNGYEIISLKE